MQHDAIQALKGRAGGSTGPVHARACEAVMSIMKAKSCTTEEALKTLKKEEETQAQAFMAWLSKIGNGFRNKMLTLDKITLLCYVCTKANCGHKKYTISIGKPYLSCDCCDGKRHTSWMSTE